MSTPIPDKCESWCARHPKDWEEKCNWTTRACSACYECPTTTPFNTPEPTQVLLVSHLHQLVVQMDQI